MPNYDVSSLVFDESTDISSQDSDPRAVRFNNDGTKMFVLGFASDAVYEYSLGTAYDVSTASFTDSFGVGSEDSLSLALAFNDTGSKMYTAGQSNADVYEYNLSTNYDVSTASYSQSLDVSSQDASPRGIEWNNDGTKMYIVGSSSDTIYEYSLGTAYDVSTASTNGSLDVSSNTLNISGGDFNNDGTKFYIASDSDPEEIDVYSLSTAYDISTGSFDQAKDVSAQAGVPTDATWNGDGSSLLLTDDSSPASIHQYNVATEPTVTTDGATNVQEDQAQLNGSLTDTGEASTDVSFEYREAGSTTWTQTSTQTFSSTSSFSETITGLNQDTEYEFRAVATNSVGTSTGSINTFTTLSTPTVSTGNASNISETSADLSGTLDDTGGFDCDVSFEYRATGSTTWNQTSTQTLTSSGSFSQTVSGLDLRTEYEFRAVATNSAGTSTGSTNTFTTDGAQFAVTITSIKEFNFNDEVLDVSYQVENTSSGTDTQDIELTTTIEGNTVVASNTDVQLNAGETITGTFNYDLTGKSTSPEETATVSSASSSDSATFFVVQQQFLETIDQLEDGQNYEFRAAAEDEFGIDTGDIKTVQTVDRASGTVTTIESTGDDIIQTEIDVEGQVDTVGDYGEIGFDVFFQYREQEDTQWQETSKTTRTSAGTVTDTITGLTEEAVYEYRFAAEFGEDLVTGSTFTAETPAPNFVITIDSIKDYLKEGRSLDIIYTAENTGNITSTQDITLAFDTEGNVVDTNTDVTIDQGATETGSLSFDTTGTAEGTYTVYISAADTQVQKTVEILDTSLVDFNSPGSGEIVADRTPELEYRVDVETSGTVEVILDGNVQESFSTPVDNQTFTVAVDPQNRNDQSRVWNLVYSGDGPTRDRTRSFTIGFNRKEVDPEQF